MVDNRQGLEVKSTIVYLKQRKKKEKKKEGKPSLLQ
jgi:hypothetical protein